MQSRLLYAIQLRSTIVYVSHPLTLKGMKNKLNAFKFALAGGIWLGACYALATAFSILNVPGFTPFAELLNQFYGSYGYSITWLGALVGALWGFAEGFVHIGIFALIYNWLIRD